MKSPLTISHTSRCSTYAKANKASRPNGWGQKREKGAMPEKGHRTSLRIEVSFPIMKTKNQERGCDCFLKGLEAVSHSGSA